MTDEAAFIFAWLHLMFWLLAVDAVCLAVLLALLEED